jgi:hypothetical protein
MTTSFAVNCLERNEFARLERMTLGARGAPNGYAWIGSPKKCLKAQALRSILTDV